MTHISFVEDKGNCKHYSINHYWLKRMTVGNDVQLGHPVTFWYELSDGRHSKLDTAWQGDLDSTFIEAEGDLSVLILDEGYFEGSNQGKLSANPFPVDEAAGALWQHGFYVGVECAKCA